MTRAEMAMIRRRQEIRCSIEHRERKSRDLSWQIYSIAGTLASLTQENMHLRAEAVEIDAKLSASKTVRKDRIK